VLDYASVPLPDGAILLSYVDVTDSIRVERALRERAEALETADRLKSEFISNVSYELRTPLNTIIGFAEILANQYFGELNARQTEYCRGIIGSSERLLTIINDILDLASIEAGRMTLDREPVEPKALLDTVCGIMNEWARSQNLKLNVDCPPDLGPIDVDERRLKQALCNLISNAIKFTPPGGTISITGRIENDEAIFSVVDTGIGIAAEDQERVFKEFERARRPEARRAGAGLGLSLVKRIVELHGGHVNMNSVPNRGTTVVCVLPTHAAPIPPAAA
jgi:signal transduction histidine kinase